LPDVVKIRNSSKSFQGILVCLFLVAAPLLVYWQVQGHAFISYDDGLYVTRNFHLQDGFSWRGISWAFRDIGTGYWHPVTWLSLMLDYRFFGLQAGGYHLTSLLIHIVNTLLLFFLFRRMTGAVWKSACVAALFALHPLNVESVAWVAERKNVLSTGLAFLTLWFYAGYVKNPAPTRYLPVFLAFALGLMAKPMLVTLPFAMLLLDYWPLGRFSELGRGRTGWRALWQDFRPLLWEKIPLFFLTAFFSWATYAASHARGALMAADKFPFPVRLANALVSYTAYIEKMFFPSSLSVFYPLPPGLQPGQVAAAALFLAAVTALALWLVKRHPYLFVGWFWYLGTLVPVIGLVQVGSQALADRYAYLTMVGLFVLAVWGGADLISKWPRCKKPAVFFSLAILAGLSWLTWRQAGYWRNSVTLFRHAAAVTEKNYLAQDNLGLALLEEGKAAEARSHFRQALQIYPRYVSAYNNMGNAFLQEGRADEALSWYREALRIDPQSVTVRYNLGSVLLRQGKASEARPHLEAAVAAEADHADARENLGVALAMEGRIPEAIGHLRAALRINPHSREAKKNLRLLEQTK